MHGCRDGYQFPDLVHALRPNPKTHIQEGWRILDFLSSKPESCHMVRLPLGNSAAKNLLSGHSSHRSTALPKLISNGNCLCVWLQCVVLLNKSAFAGTGFEQRSNGLGLVRKPVASLLSLYKGSNRSQKADVILSWPWLSRVGYIRAQLTWLLDDVGIPLDWCAQVAIPTLCFWAVTKLDSVACIDLLSLSGQPQHLAI